MSHPARLLPILVLLSTTARIAMQALFPGFLQGDDLEIIEEAAAVPLGFDSAPWDIRNLLVPHAFVRPFIALALRLGADTPHWLAFAGSLPFIACSAFNIVLLHRLARRWSNANIALGAAAIYAFHWIPLVYGTGGFPRPLAVTSTLAGLLVVERSTSRGMLLSGGVILSVAFAVRYSEIVYLLPVAWLLIRTGRFAACAWICCGYVAGVIAFAGVYDWMSWGAPFQSLVRFARFTLVDQDSSSTVATQSWHWYLGRLPQWWPVPALAVLHLTCRDVVRRAAPFVLIPLVALSLVHHKEVRYLQASMPFVCLLAAAGIDALHSRRQLLSRLLLALSIAWGLSGLTKITRRSSAALTAAQSIALQSPTCVALTQPWAFGGHLTFPDQRWVPLSVSPTPKEVQGIPSRCTAAMYLNALTAETRNALEVRECAASRIVRYGRSRPVVVYDCP